MFDGGLRNVKRQGVWNTGVYDHSFHCYVNVTEERYTNNHSVTTGSTYTKVSTHTVTYALVERKGDGFTETWPVSDLQFEPVPQRNSIMSVDLETQGLNASQLGPASDEINF